MHSFTSAYPESIDERHFFSDAALRHAEITEGYNALIKSQRYKEASQYLYDNVEAANVEMDYNGAYLWNAIEDRIVAIEPFVIDLEETIVRPFYGTTPTGAEVNQTWIV